MRSLHRSSIPARAESSTGNDESDEYPWRLFLVLFGASLIGVIAIIPYSLALSTETVQKNPLPIPLPVLVVLQLFQNAIFLGVAVGIGLLTSRKLGLGAPILEAWLYKRGETDPTRVLIASAIAGAAVAALTAIVAQLVFVPLMPQLSQAGKATLPLWKRFLACFYGALNEEILMRLFVLSGLLWLIAKLWHTSQGQPSRVAFWITNVLVAFLFGLAHMPAAALIMPINSMSTLYILSLNGLGSLLFGYLFWRHGLESSMIAHFSADIVLQVIAPALMVICK